MPDPAHGAKADQFHAACVQMVDEYIERIENDLNRLAKKTKKDVDYTYAHNDLTRHLVRQIPPNMMAGLLVECLLRLIKRKGR